MDNNDDHAFDPMKYLMAQFDAGFGVPPKLTAYSARQESPIPKIRFVGGTFDGREKQMREFPDVYPVRIGNEQQKRPGLFSMFSADPFAEQMAVAEFYEVAVYELTQSPIGPYYKFVGYSEMMEGL